MQKIIGNLQPQTSEENKETLRKMADMQLNSTKRLIDQGVFKTTNKEITKRGNNASLNFGVNQGISDLSLLNNGYVDLNSLYYKISNIITKDKYNANNFSTVYKMFDELEKQITEKLKNDPSLKEEFQNNFDEFKSIIDGKYKNYTFIDGKLENIKNVIDKTQFIKSLDQKESENFKDLILKSIVDNKSTYAQSNFNDYFDNLKDVDIDDDTKENMKEQFLERENAKNVNEMSSETIKKFKNDIINNNDGSYDYYTKKIKTLISGLIDNSTTNEELENIVPNYHWTIDAKNRKVISLQIYYKDLISIANVCEKNVTDLDKLIEFTQIIYDKAENAYKEKNKRKIDVSDTEKKSYEALMKKLEAILTKIEWIGIQKEEFEQKNNTQAQSKPSPENNKKVKQQLDDLEDKLMDSNIPTPENNEEQQILQTALKISKKDSEISDLNETAKNVDKLLSEVEKKAPLILYYNPNYVLSRKEDIKKIKKLFEDNKNFKNLNNQNTINAILNAIQSVNNGDDAKDINSDLSHNYNIIISPSNDITSFSVHSKSEDLVEGLPAGAAIGDVLVHIFASISNYLSGEGTMEQISQIPLPYFNRRPFNQYDVIMNFVGRTFNIIDRFADVPHNNDNNNHNLIIYILLGLLLMYILYLQLTIIRNQNNNNNNDNNNNNNYPQIIWVQPRLADIPDERALQLIPNPIRRGRGRGRGGGIGEKGGQSILSHVGLTNETSLPKNSQAFLNQYGDQIIKKMVISKSLVSKAAQMIYLGKVVDNDTKIPFDDIYHLKLILYLENGVIARIEKIPHVKIGENIENQNGELLDVPMHNEEFTLKELVETTIKNMGINNFIRYHGFTYNCGNLIMNLINSAGLLTEEMRNFLIQTADEEQFKRDHRIRYEFGNFVTDSGNIVSQLTGGSEYY